MVNVHDVSFKGYAIGAAHYDIRRGTKVGETNGEQPGVPCTLPDVCYFTHRVVRRLAREQIVHLANTHVDPQHDVDMDVAHEDMVWGFVSCCLAGCGFE